VIASVLFLSVVLAPSVVFASRIDRPQIYLTTRRPWEIEELGKWLRTSRYRDSAILATTMNWQSTYLILYVPEFGSRILEYSYWQTDAELGDFIRQRRPALLITADQDREYQLHIEAFLAHPLSQREVVHTVGKIRVYDIRD
jgi:hypothetical protein